MSRGRHSAAPAAPSRSYRLPALALVTLLGAGVLGSGPQPSAESTELAPLSAEPVADRSQAAASRSSARVLLDTLQEAASATQAAGAAAPTPAPVPSVVPAPDAAPEPAAAPAPEPLPAVTGQLWTTDAVNVRTGPSVDAAQVTTAPSATVVDVTGAVEGDWSQVVWEGAVAWVSSRFLSETEPQAAPAAPAGPSGAACGVNPEIESGLRSNAIAVYRSVCAAFPQVSAYGGVRPGDSGDHGTGRAVDVMISGDLGWDIARYVQANAGSLGVTYVIYQQQMWMAGDPAGAWRAMEDRGGVTANHYDHVHVSTS